MLHKKILKIRSYEQTLVFIFFCFFLSTCEPFSLSSSFLLHHLSKYFKRGSNFKVHYEKTSYAYERMERLALKFPLSFIYHLQCTTEEQDNALAPEKKIFTGENVLPKTSNSIEHARTIRGLCNNRHSGIFFFLT